jgi:Sec-independent protein translocase protein TatA
VFGISMWETAMIFLVALVVLGPKQLIEVARAAGKLYRDIQKMVWDVRQSVDLDAVMSSSPPAPPPRAPERSPASAPEAAAGEAPLLPARASGPDFYAELLESSKREAETEAGRADQPASAAISPPDAGDARPDVDQQPSKPK